MRCEILHAAHVGVCLTGSMLKSDLGFRCLQKIHILQPGILQLTADRE